MTPARFQYTFRDESKGEIWESIAWLDREGMNVRTWLPCGGARGGGCGRVRHGWTPTQIIETQDPDRFSAYLKQFGNTICGRYPISVRAAWCCRCAWWRDAACARAQVLLHMMRASSLPMEVSFVKYAQSSKCRSLHDSSVSYASAVVRQVSK